MSCQNEKSQLQNKASAMVVLKAKLLAMKKAEEKAHLDGLRGDVQASWGDQMRNYVLNPYQIVKDLRTGYEVGNPTRCSTATSTASSRPASAGDGAPSAPSARPTAWSRDAAPLALDTGCDDAPVRRRFRPSQVQRLTSSR